VYVCRLKVYKLCISLLVNNDFVFHNSPSKRCKHSLAWEKCVVESSSFPTRFNLINRYHVTPHFIRHLLSIVPGHRLVRNTHVAPVRQSLVHLNEDSKFGFIIHYVLFKDIISQQVFDLEHVGHHVREHLPSESQRCRLQRSCHLLEATRHTFLPLGSTAKRPQLPRN